MKKQRFSKALLMERVARSGKFASKDTHDRASAFISYLCGTLESDYPDVAEAIARGAGMGFLYDKEGDSNA